MSMNRSKDKGFSVYQFCETLESCVLPIDWVKNGEVKYDSRKASEYAKNGKQPYKKWPTYKVRPLCDKVFDSYNRAYQAESILLEKSDLDSSDVENLYNPNLILNKKRQRRPVLIPGAVPHHTTSSEITDDESSDRSDRSTILIQNPPPVPVIIGTGGAHENTGQDENTMNKLLTHEDEPECDNTLVYDIQTANEPVLDNTSSVEIEPSVVINGNIPITLATTDDIKELKTIILQQNALIEKQNSKIDTLMSMVLELSKRGKKRGHSAEDFSQKHENDSDFAFSYPDLTLPLETLESIAKLEEMLKDEVVLNPFRSFLLRLGGHNLKMVIKHIVCRVYSLGLQGRVNYTGREGKCAMSALQQTKVIIEVMQRNTGKTETEAIDEYMYHMQHVSDRVRSAERMATRMAK